MTNNLTKNMGDVALYKRLLAYMWPYRNFLWLSIFGNLLYAGMEVLAADTLQLIVDSFNTDNAAKHLAESKGVILNVLSILLGPNFNAMLVIPIIIILLALFRGIGSFLGAYCLDIVGRSTIHSLRLNLFDHYLKLPTDFYDTNTNAFLVNRITFNVTGVTEAVTKALMTVTREGLTVIGLIIYMFYLNWALSLIFLVVVPFIGFIVSYISKRFRKYSTRIQNSMGDVTHVVSEAVGGSRVIKIFHGEDYERGRFAKASQYNLDQSLKMSLVSAVSSPVMHFVMAIAMGILLALGLSPAIIHSLSPGTFVAFLTAAGLLAKPLKQLSSILTVIQKGLAAAEDLFTQLDVPTEKNDGEFSCQTVKGDINISHLSFAYPSTKTVLSDINVSVKAGEIIALVGKSGSGKSTLVNLLPRFYRYTQGNITLDGVELNDYRLENLREHIALVNQHITLFNDTIYNNIAYGTLRHKTREQVIEAVRIAHVDEFVSAMSNGLDTMVGDEGILLSGGQRQRIAIARAILKNAPILILDEATSALDNDSERLIQDALQAVMRGRTSFVIAHRLSTVEKADCILCMHNGKIVQRGTHQSLLTEGGLYADLYRQQFKQVE